MRHESPEAIPQKQPVRQEVFHGTPRELINNAYAKALEIFRREGTDILERFKELYPLEEIQKNLDRCEELARIYKEKQEQNELLTKASLAAEALMFHQIGLSDWFSAAGVQVYVEKTSQYDDFINKTDMVLTFVTKEGEEPLSITVDVTIGILSLNEKIHSIKQEIDEKRLSHVKYHETLSGDPASLDCVPRVVLGVAPEELGTLLKLWVQETEVSKNRLKEHPVQLALVRQIEEQLLSYQKYAQMSKDETTAHKYDALIEIIGKVKGEKEKLYADAEDEQFFRFLTMVRSVLRSQLMFPGSRVPEGVIKGNPEGKATANRLRQRW